MKIENIAAALEQEGLLLEAPAVAINAEHISCDSRQVTPGTLFVCKGLGFKEAYLAQAAAKGAVCYLAQQRFETQLPALIAIDVNKAYAIAVRTLCGHADRKVRLAGVTGTVGKTTTTTMLHFILSEHAGREAGILCSRRYFDGLEEADPVLTTPEPPRIQATCARLAELGVPYCAVEVSSQAYKVERVYGLRFEVGVVTNIAEDHISPTEHADYTDYLECKLRLLDNSRVAVVHAGCRELQACLERARRSCERVIVVGSEGSELWAEDVRRSGKGYTFNARDAGGSCEPYYLPMEGLHNVQDALLAIAAAKAMGVGSEAIARGLEKVEVPGRNRYYEYEDGSRVIIDFALSELSYKASFDWIHAEHPAQRVTVICGCNCHDDERRLARQVRDLRAYADHVFITEELYGHPYPPGYYEGISSALDAAGMPHTVVRDRPQAIRTALDGRQPGELFVLNGALYMHATAPAARKYSSDEEVVEEYFAKRGIKRRA